MKILLLILAICPLYITYGQTCYGKYDTTMTGECLSPDACGGSLLDGRSCEGGTCCISQTLTSTATTCITEKDFAALYPTPRAPWLRVALNAGMNLAGICSNCQAKAAFLAVAATMTNDFQIDELQGTDGQFAVDDTSYGNFQPGDGSLFRQRGFFGIRGRTQYTQLAALMPQYAILANPQLAALINISAQIAGQRWKTPNFLTGPALTQYADGTFYGFSMLWYNLTGGIDKLSDATLRYAKFLNNSQCGGGELYPGQGPICQYNTTHKGTCTPDCIQGLEDGGEYCGCSGGKGEQCPNSPPHVICCLDTCSQELKLDLGIVMDSSGSVGSSNFQLQLTFVRDLLSKVNVGENKTHVGIINYSTNVQTLTNLNKEYELRQKIQQVNKANFIGGSTNTAGALQQANTVFSPANGLRPEGEGAQPLIFLITDGQSDDQTATINAAAVLKDNGIHIVTVGIGNSLDLVELTAACTPPAYENYFPMSNYAALDQKIAQFTSKVCSEPAPIPENTTVTGECGKDKYKFLKIKIIKVGNKFMIKIKLFNGKVKIFFSFKSRNPKDPADFLTYKPKRSTATKNAPVVDDESELVLDKPNADVEFVYLGVKGVEDDNQFEVNFDDCANVFCKSSASTMTISMVLISICIALFSF
ncbi:unnamed protein product [Adineta steineri]|uniref:VWFA domain-containing protein n=1 Tax=Adineta steineri TaxID=433720 RepID=A0A815C0H5_9BILA|nr:unnamed protein product [Adineta steineri]CAF1324794.1 unnamed protein product [Adineta steineri]CAF1559075.1 unnamed protein product [Adineta steineri]CAF1586516.1 unnamed protein product [Adineta steineri]